METKHERQVKELVERIKLLRRSLPATMIASAERRVLSQVSVRIATDALLELAKESQGKEDAQ